MGETEGEPGLVLMGRAMFSKSLIQFSVDGRGCVPFLLFDLRPNCVEVMKIMVTSITSSHACTATLSAPNAAAGHSRPTSPPETPGHSQARPGQPLMGSLLPSPASWYTQGSVCALQESASPALWKFWRLYGGINGDSSKRAYAIPSLRH